MAGRQGQHLIGKRGPGRRKGQGIGVYTRNTILAKINKNTREGRLLQQVRSDLTKHIGGNPTAIQRMLIERAAVLNLHVAMLDQKILDGAILTQMDNNQYLAWSNSLVRTLAQLGLNPATPSAPNLTDVLTSIAERRKGAEAAD